MPVVQPIVFCHSTEPASRPGPQSVKAAIITYLQKVAQRRDVLPIVLGPEFYFSVADGRNPITPLPPNSGKLDFLVDLVEISAAYNALIVPGTVVLQAPMGLRNYAPVFYHGEEVYQVHKRTRGLATEANWFVPHRTAQNIAAHPDIVDVQTPDQQALRIGVEICNDCGSMKAFLGDRQEAYPDIYLLTAGGMSTIDILRWDRNGQRYALTRGNEQYVRQNYTITPAQNEQLDWFALHRNRPGLVIQSDGYMARVAVKSGLDNFTFLMPLESTITQTSPNGLPHQIGAVHLFPPIDVNN